MTSGSGATPFPVTLRACVRPAGEKRRCRYKCECGSKAHSQRPLLPRDLPLPAPSPAPLGSDWLSPALGGTPLSGVSVPPLSSLIGFTRPALSCSAPIGSLRCRALLTEPRAHWRGYIHPLWKGCPPSFFRNSGPVITSFHHRS